MAFKEGMKKLDVITIGDGMITLNPVMKGPLRFNHQFERGVGGAELNVAIGCARLGLKTGWISRLGNDPFGQHILHFARGENIDVSQIELVDHCPTSFNVKEIRENGDNSTFYYRNPSPLFSMTPEDIDEQYIKKAQLLHVTGVFPAVGGQNVAILHKVVELAKKHGVPISFDPNIRLKLWSAEQAREALLPILSSVDLFLTGLDEAELLLGTSNISEIIEKSKEYGMSHIAIKLGDQGSVGYYNGTIIESAPVKPLQVVDTVGAGDGFDAGMIYGFLHGWDAEKTFRFANTIGSMVVQTTGDNEGLPTLDEILMFMGEKQQVSR